MEMISNDYTGAPEMGWNEMVFITEWPITRKKKEDWAKWFHRFLQNVRLVLRTWISRQGYMEIKIECDLIVRGYGPWTRKNSTADFLCMEYLVVVLSSHVIG